MSIIPARHEDVPVWRTRGRYRKEMKRGYSKKTYHCRSKDETIFSVVKRTMGDDVRSIVLRAQNNEMRLKIISHNAARIAAIAYSFLRGLLQSPVSPRPFSGNQFAETKSGFDDQRKSDSLTAAGSPR